MDIDTINALSDPLRRIHLATLSWDDGKLGDQEEELKCARLTLARGPAKMGSRVALVVRCRRQAT